MNSSMPLNPNKIDTKLLFYKNKTLTAFDETMINSTLPTFIGIHGWSPSLKRRSIKTVPGHVLFIADIFDVIGEKTNGNFIIVNWRKGSSTLNYPQSCSNIRVIGRQVANWINEMEDLNVTNVHIIGHSLGAHMAGYIGKELQRMGKIIGRITGLDPAGPAFSFPTSWYVEFPNELEKVHLWHSDAQFVDVIHSDAGTFGNGHYGHLKPLGHVDFYPSMGKDQPFCDIYRYHNRLDQLKDRMFLYHSAFGPQAFCDHRMSKVYFIDSIKRPELYYFCNKLYGNCNTLGFSATKPASRHTYFIPEEDLPKFNKHA